MELVNVCLLTTVCVKLLGPYLYVLLYEGKCKWSYGPSCPVDFPLNIFIHSFIHVMTGEAIGHLLSILAVDVFVLAANVNI